MDLDEGRIFVDGEWLSTEELKYAIKTKISSDDFDVEHLAHAMKTLEKIMEESTMIEIRVTETLQSSLKKMSDDIGESVGSIVRKALEGYLGGEITAPEPEEKSEDDEEENKSKGKKGRGKKKDKEPEDEPEDDEETPEEDAEDDDNLFDESEEEEDEEKSDEDEDLEIEHISRRRRRSHR